MSQQDALAGWIPLFLSERNNQRSVEWAYMGNERFTDPFCHDTLQRLASRPFNRLFRRQSDMELLRQRERMQPGLPLQGIVFHMSRCGSTLVSQWLTSLPDSVVLAEPEPLDTLLQWPTPESDTTTIRALLAALGQPRRNNDRRLFLKTDCWHMVHIDRLLAAFPTTPWIFLYRDPLEVLVSHQRAPGWQLVPGVLAGHGLRAPAEVMTHPLGHGAWVLSVILERAREALLKHSNGLLLNYSELTAALEDRLPQHFGIVPDAQDSANLRAVTARHAKQPQTEFKTDVAEKQAAADDEVVALAARWLDTPYRALEQLRTDLATSRRTMTGTAPYLTVP